jgi:hypothetical protein
MDNFDLRKYLAEGKLYENDDAQRDALMAKVKGQHAKNVVQDGKFSRVNLFGSGDNKSKLVNVMDELRDEISYFKTPEEQDSDDYDDLMIDLKAAKEIARAVKEMGGKVEYGGKGLKYVYTVNGKGDLLGQAV